jgi:hypothetical protein
MKKIICAAILLMFITELFADNFQLIYRDGSSRYTVSYSFFRILDGSGNELTRGYSDKYGRIIVNLGKGDYTCEVDFRNRNYKKTITITGDAGIREIQLQ